MAPKVVTFDCYGTLVRWPETLRAVFETLVAPQDAARFHEDFGEAHVRLKSGPYVPYGRLLCQALEQTMQKWALAGAVEARERLLQAVRVIPPYPDVLPALRSLARRFRLAIISNTEDALIAETVRGLEVAFEVITAEQAKAYKPDHRLFHYAHQRLGVAADEVVHVAAGLATDMVPAYELGLARIWINRRGEAPDPARPPSAVLSDLSGLERLLT